MCIYSSSLLTQDFHKYTNLCHVIFLVVSLLIKIYYTDAILMLFQVFVGVYLCTGLVACKNSLVYFCFLKEYPQMNKRCPDIV